MAEPQAADPNTPLSDAYLTAHATDPQVAPYFSSEERRRLRRLTPNLPRMEAPPPSGWQTFLRQVGDAIGPRPKPGEMPFANAVGPQAQAVANTPLTRPTGIDVIDGLTSPLSLGTAALSLGGKAVGMLRPGISAAADVVKAAEIGPELKSLLLGHRGEKVAKIAEKLRDALAESGAVEAAPATPPPSAATAGTSARPAPTRPPARATPPSGGAASLTLDSLTPAEKTQAAKWFAQGMTPEDILKNIGISRKLTKGFGTPTPDQAAASVADRNAHGRWPE